jgi:hypothetical protein
MSERDPAQEDPVPEGADDEQTETPFDHPLFLPVVLLGLSLWFLWDGFIVPLEGHLVFNRLGFAVLALATLYFGIRGVREMRRDQDSSSDSDSGLGSPGGDDAPQ